MFLVQLSSAAKNDSSYADKRNQEIRNIWMLAFFLTGLEGQFFLKATDILFALSIDGEYID